MNNIKKIRLKQNITQKKLAELIGIGQSTLSEIESGKYLPRIDIAKKIAKALSSSLNEIFPEDY